MLRQSFYLNILRLLRALFNCIVFMYQQTLACIAAMQEWLHTTIFMKPQFMVSCQSIQQICYTLLSRSADYHGLQCPDTAFTVMEAILRSASVLYNHLPVPINNYPCWFRFWNQDFNSNQIGTSPQPSLRKPSHQQPVFHLGISSSIHDGSTKLCLLIEVIFFSWLLPYICCVHYCVVGYEFGCGFCLPQGALI